MISILVGLLVLCVFLWILHRILELLIPQLGLPPQVGPIVVSIVGLVALCWLLARVGYLPFSFGLLALAGR